MNYKAVLLDADETVFDFCLSERTAFCEAIAAYGIPVTDRLYEIYHECNQALWKALERGEVTKDRLRVLRFEHWEMRTGIPVDASDLNRIYGEKLSASHHLLPGAMGFLQELNRRLPIFLTTNGIAEVQRRRIAESGIAPYLTRVFISEELGCSKPDPAYYDWVLAKTGLAPADCIAFGDSLTSDIAGAANAGIDSCWFNPSRAPLTGAATPTYTVENYQQFLSLIGE